MNHEPIRLERQGHTAVVTLNRPERKNAFNESLFDGLAAITKELKASPPRAVVITGAGETAFCAGFDVNPDNPMLDRIIKTLSTENRNPAKQLIRAIRRTVDDFISLPVPLIAALNGSAYGGGAELAVRCDLRVIDPGAVICFSEVRLGLMPDWGGGAALARLLGSSRAADLILTARKVGAPEAHALGLVNRISRPGGALAEALALAEEIAANGPRAVKCALTLLREHQEIPYSTLLDREEELAAALIASGECIQGVGAFLEKKKPALS